MEQSDVAAAMATLAREGREPSVGNIRKLLGRGSMRDITRLRKQLLPAPAPEPEAPDPVQRAEEAVRLAEQNLADARELVDGREP